MKLESDAIYSRLNLFSPQFRFWWPSCLSSLLLPAFQRQKLEWLRVTSTVGFPSASRLIIEERTFSHFLTCSPGLYSLAILNFDFL